MQQLWIDALGAIQDGINPRIVEQMLRSLPANKRDVALPVGWEIVDKPPVFFVRTESMRPLPGQSTGAALRRYGAYLTCPSIYARALAWLLESMRPDTDYPGLELVGEMGNGGRTRSHRA